jgi:amino acid transporter
VAITATPSTGFKSVGTFEALSIGIGGIVGGGFFATIGLAIAGARGATVLSFAVGGAIALLTAYSYVGLTQRYPGSGGTVNFIRQAYGGGLFAASVSTLLILSYVAIMAVYANALAGYATSYFPAATRGGLTHVVGSLAIVGLMVLNFTGGALIRRSENALVIGKLVILGAFVAAGLAAGGLVWARFEPSDWVAPRTIVASGIVAFLSYEGFELIANASARIANPRRTLPIAFYGSVGIALVIYILVAVVAIGHTSFAVLHDAENFALSAAAAGFMGSFGFGLLALGAVLASASAINADLFGAARLPAILADAGQAPRLFHNRFPDTPFAGLIAVSGLALVAVNLLNLHAISAATSAGFLIVFSVVNFAALKLAAETGSKRWIPLVAGGACLLALATLLSELAADPTKGSSLGAVIAIVASAVVLQLANRATRRRA